MRDARFRLGAFLATLLFVGVTGSVSAESIALLDAGGHQVKLIHPAQRVVSLAPNLTELIYAIGAGNQLVAVSQYSDFPDAAKTLPRIGSASSVDIERILALKPDLLLAWKTGTPAATQEKLRRLHLPVFELEFSTLEDIAAGMKLLGRLTGHTTKANKVSDKFESELNRLSENYSGKKPVTVFYQIWNHPLMTANGKHYVSDIIRICGGKNIFAGLGPLVSTVGMESVVTRAPEAIVAAASPMQQKAWREQWVQWKSIPAVKSDAVFMVSPDLLSRPGPRILKGATLICRDLDTVRNNN